MILNNVSKFLAVSGTAAWIRIKDHVTLGCHPLEFVIENIAVREVRSAMNVQDQGIFFVRIEVRWLLQPGLVVLAVKAVVRNLFRLGWFWRRERVVIAMRQLR